MDHQHGLVTGFAIDKGVDLWFNVNGSSQIDNGELTIDNYPETHVHRQIDNGKLTIDNYPENHVHRQIDNGELTIDNYPETHVHRQIDNGELTIDNYPEIHVHRQIDNYPENHVHLESKTFEGVVDFEIDKPTLVKQGNWGDYARGAKFALQKRFKLQTGITGTIKGSLPVGGLSSSAAVLIAYVMAFAKANNITLAPFEVMKIASEAERSGLYSFG